ncbi:saccharopine dehydrogenase family protein [Oligella ureolytica]
MRYQEGIEDPPWYANYEWKRAKRRVKMRVSLRYWALALTRVWSMPMSVLPMTIISDKVDSIGIIDINAGNHGRYFATNFVS